jgi:hypothetical protein
MSVLLRERGSVALVPNVPGNFGWEPFPPDKALSILPRPVRSAARGKRVSRAEV